MVCTSSPSSATARWRPSSSLHGDRGRLTVGQVVLIHGAWHGAWCWDGVARELQRQHVSVEVVNLPLTGLADDVAAARVAIEGAGEGAVVCGHSYGGMVISNAATGLPGVKRLVYLC